MPLQIVEFNAEDSSSRCYNVQVGGTVVPADTSAAQPLAFGVHRVAAAARRLFLPRSLRDERGYAWFQLLDTVQATSSYLRGILTIHSTLVGLGLGSGDDVALSATLALILKDGSSMLGSLLLSYTFSVAFDAEVKFWRLLADVINDIGLTIELLAPLGGRDWFLPLTCTANVCKAVCGVAAGATRVAISNHFAADGNVAEVQAKEGTQETAVTLLGLLLGFLLAPWLNKSQTTAFTAFGALTLLHVVCNYYAVKALGLRTLNHNRLQAQLVQMLSDDGDALITPSTMAATEPVLPLQYRRAFLLPRPHTAVLIQLGASLRDITNAWLPHCAAVVAVRVEGAVLCTDWNSLLVHMSSSASAISSSNKGTAQAATSPAARKRARAHSKSSVDAPEIRSSTATGAGATGVVTVAAALRGGSPGFVIAAASPAATKVVAYCNHPDAATRLHAYYAAALWQRWFNAQRAAGNGHRQLPLLLRSEEPSEALEAAIHKAHTVLPRFITALNSAGWDTERVTLTEGGARLQFPL